MDGWSRIPDNAASASSQRSGGSALPAPGTVIMASVEEDMGEGLYALRWSGNRISVFSKVGLTQGQSLILKSEMSPEGKPTLVVQGPALPETMPPPAPGRRSYGPSGRGSPGSDSSGTASSGGSATSGGAVSTGGGLAAGVGSAVGAGASGGAPASLLGLVLEPLGDFSFTAKILMASARAEQQQAEKSKKPSEYDPGEAAKKAEEKKPAEQERQKPVSREQPLPQATGDQRNAAAKPQTEISVSDLRQDVRLAVAAEQALQAASADPKAAAATREAAPPVNSPASPPNQSPPPQEPATRPAPGTPAASRGEAAGARPVLSPEVVLKEALTQLVKAAELPLSSPGADSQALGVGQARVPEEVADKAVGILLRAAGLTANPGSLEAGRALLENNVPIDRQNIQALMDVAAGTAGEDRTQTLKAAARLAAHDIPVSPPLAEGLAGVLSRRESVAGLLDKAATALSGESLSPEARPLADTARQMLDLMVVDLEGEDAPLALERFISTFGRQALGKALALVETATQAALETNPALSKIDQALTAVLKQLAATEQASGQTAVQPPPVAGEGTPSPQPAPPAGQGQTAPPAGQTGAAPEATVPPAAQPPPATAEGQPSAPATAVPLPPGASGGQPVVVQPLPALPGDAATMLPGQVAPQPPPESGQSPQLPQQPQQPQQPPPGNSGTPPPDASQTVPPQQPSPPPTSSTPGVPLPPVQGNIPAVPAQPSVPSGQTPPPVTAQPGATPPAGAPPPPLREGGPDVPNPVPTPSMTGRNQPDAQPPQVVSPDAQPQPPATGMAPSAPVTNVPPSGQGPATPIPPDTGAGAAQPGAASPPADVQARPNVSAEPPPEVAASRPPVENAASEPAQQAEPPPQSAAMPRPATRPYGAINAYLRTAKPFPGVDALNLPPMPKVARLDQAESRPAVPADQAPAAGARPATQPGTTGSDVPADGDEQATAPVLPTPGAVPGATRQPPVGEGGQSSTPVQLPAAEGQPPPLPEPPSAPSAPPPASREAQPQPQPVPVPAPGVTPVSPRSDAEVVPPPQTAKTPASPPPAATEAVPPSPMPAEAVLWRFPPRADAVARNPEPPAPVPQTPQTPQVPQTLPAEEPPQVPRQVQPQQALPEVVAPQPLPASSAPAAPALPPPAITQPQPQSAPPALEIPVDGQAGRQAPSETVRPSGPGLPTPTSSVPPAPNQPAAAATTPGQRQAVPFPPDRLMQQAGTLAADKDRVLTWGDELARSREARDLLSNRDATMQTLRRLDSLFQTPGLNRMEIELLKPSGFLDRFLNADGQAGDSAAAESRTLMRHLLDDDPEKRQQALRDLPQRDRETLRQLASRLTTMEREALRSDPVISRLADAATSMRDLGRQLLAVKAENLAGKDREPAMMLAEIPFKLADNAGDGRMQMFYRKTKGRGEGWSSRVILDLNTTSMGPVLGDMRFFGQDMVLNMFVENKETAVFLSESGAELQEKLLEKGFRLKPRFMVLPPPPSKPEIQAQRPEIAMESAHEAAVPAARRTKTGRLDTKA